MFPSKRFFFVPFAFLFALLIGLSSCEDERSKRGQDINSNSSNLSSEALPGGEVTPPPPPRYNWRTIEQRINDANGQYIYVVPNAAASNGLEILYAGRGWKMASPFVNGFATVKDSLFLGGLINAQGEMVLPMRYHKIGTVTSRGLIEVALLDSSGRVLEGILDTAGNAVVPIQYDVADLMRGSDLFKVGEGKGNARRYGLVNDKAELVLPIEYKEIGNFSEGFATVKKGNLYGYIDVLGRIAQEPKFSTAFPFRYGATWAKEGEFYVLLDHNFNVVGDQYYQAFATLEYIEAPQNIHSDNYGETLPQVKSQTFATADSSVGCAQNGKWGVVTTQGEVKLPFEYKRLGIQNGTWVGQQ